MYLFNPWKHQIQPSHWFRWKKNSAKCPSSLKICQKFSLSWPAYQRVGQVWEKSPLRFASKFMHWLIFLILGFFKIGFPMIIFKKSDLTESWVEKIVAIFIWLISTMQVIAMWCFIILCKETTILENPNSECFLEYYGSN